MSEKPHFAGTIKFFLPGPVWVRPEVLAAMAKPMIGHRGKSYADLQERIEKRIPSVFDTRNFVLLATSSAPGLMEAGLRTPIRRACSRCPSAPSPKVAQIATDNGFEADKLSFEWERPRIRAGFASPAGEEVRR
jgi:aspartate aminotransferase-like enzyme